MTFWERLAERQAQERQAVREAWLDVEPALCETCQEIKRTVLFGICAPCFEAWATSDRNCKEPVPNSTGAISFSR